MLENKKFLITGGNGGIGFEIVKTLLLNKSKIILLLNKNTDNIDQLIQKSPEHKSNIEIIKVDLTDVDELKNKIFGIKNIDGFIHSVTLPIENKSTLDMEWGNFQSNLDLQVKSFHEILKNIIPTMKERKCGKIINILTEYVVGVPPKKISSYLVSKYALLGMTKSLAVELGEFGINVNSVSPSMTNTTLISNIPNKLKEITASQIPLKRLAETKDVASAVLFLCSEQSNFLTGENILVSGGNTMQ